MTTHIAQDALKGKIRQAKHDSDTFQPSKATGRELAEELSRALLPSVRSRLIGRDAEGRNVV